MRNRHYDGCLGEDAPRYAKGHAGFDSLSEDMRIAQEYLNIS